VVYHYIQGIIGQDFEMNIAHECVYEAGGNDAFWAMTDMFYARPDTYSTPDLDAMLRQLADEQELDAEPLISCLEEQSTSSKVSQDWKVGGNRGALGTPTFWAFGPTGKAIQVDSNYVAMSALLRDMVEDAS
jgi:protein-disulfide isomerase